jgi:hypothetical protein
LPEVEEGGQLSTFVVSSQHVNCIGEAEFKGHNQGQYFDGEGSAINVIAQEEVLSLFNIASSLGLK